MFEDLGVVVRGEVAVFLARGGVGLHDAIDQRPQAVLPLIGAERTTEVLRGDDRGRVDAPAGRELHALLLEDGLAGLPVGLDDVATLPLHLVVGVHPLLGEDPLDDEPLGVGACLAACCTRCGRGHIDPLFGVISWIRMVSR